MQAYSSPPKHGAAIVNKARTDKELMDFPQFFDYG
jgi:aspartate/tyrosine/aromatic aminotransferase